MVSSCNDCVMMEGLCESYWYCSGRLNCERAKGAKLKKRPETDGKKKSLIFKENYTKKSCYMKWKLVVLEIMTKITWLSIIWAQTFQKIKYCL